MLTSRIIPCLDIRDGRVVKGVRFSNLRDAGDPVLLASAYQAQGADELVVLDVSATAEGRAASLETIRAIRNVLSIPLTVGGGVRRLDDALTLLGAGADKVGINTAAVDRPMAVRELADRVGSQCVVLAVDAASTHSGDSWEIVTHSGKTRHGIDAIGWVRAGEALGAGEILLTSWDRDGTRSGYDLDLIAAVSAATSLPMIASGGADTTEHMIEAFRAGADAVLAASIFHDQDTTVNIIKQQLARSGVEVRL